LHLTRAKKVELTIRKLNILRLEYVPEDSDDDILQPDIETISAIFAELIDQPLIFKIYAPFEVTEITGMLNSVINKSEHAIFWGHLAHLGLSTKSFGFFLTHLFHLRGRDLQLGITLPVDVIALYPEKKIPLKGQPGEIDLYYPLDHIGYRLTKISGQEVKGNYHKSFKIEDRFFGPEHYKVAEKGTWSLANSLNQSRDFNFNFTTKNVVFSFNIRWHSIEN
jgi:hypothetical protein